MFRVLVGLGLGMALGAHSAYAGAKPPTVLYSFPEPSHAPRETDVYAQPDTPLLLGANGAVFGTTTYAGDYGKYSYEFNTNTGLGTVFELTPPLAGQIQWTYTQIYAFPYPPAKGLRPVGGIIADATGALYGVTNGGGRGPCISRQWVNANGCGVAYKLTPPGGSGPWTATVLHTFIGSAQGGTDGASPATGLVIDPQGALYGTTLTGGRGDNGTVFKLTPPVSGSGDWTETLLYEFPADGVHGANPTGLIRDPTGILYGVTGRPYVTPPKNPNGVIWKLSPPSSGTGQWTLQVIHSFADYAPTGSIVADRSGALYVGGVNDQLTGYAIIRLVPSGPGATAWRQSILARLDGDLGNLLVDPSGGLYGTTVGGGEYGRGTLSKLVPSASGAAPWHLETLYAFHGMNGHYPMGEGGLVMDANGALYGTTFGGGTYNRGTVFQFVP